MDSKNTSSSDVLPDLFLSHFPEAEIHDKNSRFTAFFISLLICLVISVSLDPSWGFSTFVVASVVSGVTFSCIHLYGRYRFLIVGKERVLTVIDWAIILVPGEEKHCWFFPKHTHVIPLEEEEKVEIMLPGDEKKSSQITVVVSYRIKPEFITSPSLRHWSFVDFRDSILHNNFLEVVKSSVEYKIIESYLYYVNQNYPYSLVPPVDLAIREANKHFTSFFGAGMPISLKVTLLRDST